VLAPYTGDNAVQGAISSAGCLAGVAPVNAAGGVLGARLACKPFDTRGDPADAVPAANQMMSSANPVMVIGPGDEAVATVPIVTAQQVTNFATIGDPHFDHQSNPYFWRVSPSDALQGIALGYYAATRHMTRASARLAWSQARSRSGGSPGPGRLWGGQRLATIGRYDSIGYGRCFEQLSAKVRRWPQLGSAEAGI
jgi:ABC-type branched-subunit amino acid transport system substrate-binding protein